MIGKPGEISLVDRAIGFAARAHAKQRRKTGYAMPYIAHPFGVAMILQQMCCDETVVAAGLLHDVIEDTDETLGEIRARFGDEVANIVAFCTEPPKKRDNWEERKVHMIKSLENAPIEAKLVAAADKFHNLNHTLANFRDQGESVWKRFGRNGASQAWYYRSVYGSIIANVPDPDLYPIFERLRQVIDELFRDISSAPPKFD